MILVQMLEKPVQGYWDGGLKDTFEWSIDVTGITDYSRVGSWEANHWFTVKTGATEKRTLSNAKQHLRAMIARRGLTCTFEYREE